MSENMLPPVLDPCSGGRAFYFDRESPDVLYCDNREWSGELCDGRTYEVKPDCVLDVTSLPFPDESFSLVVFDPPHLDVGSGWQVDKYGKLPSNWKEWMTKAFSECWRVLRPHGTMVFKWYEYHIGISEVLACAPVRPLFGNRRPKGSKTHWLVFFKGVDE